MKPIVGVMPLWDEKRDSLWMLPGYLDGIRQAGGLPVMLPLTHDPDEIAQLAGLCCGFLLTGGHDVSPARYGQAPLPGLIADCPARDEMEQAVLAHALAQDKPVLGICRGIQLINVLLGGTLYQDLPRQHPSAVTHHQRPPYDVPSHTVRLVPGTPLHDLLGQDTLAVNSYHHQAIDRLADGLTAMAYAPDGLVEAVCLPSQRFLWAVQWHPEFSWRVDAASRAILARFVQAMG